mmetsp:Transcript_164714/g.528423  ORF Transcript_164714/g.528423 Transcript_164714/m.528423 type:complete len:171 (-) Transcript_164714:228-740(-)
MFFCCAKDNAFQEVDHVPLDPVKMDTPQEEVVRKEPAPPPNKEQAIKEDPTPPPASVVEPPAPALEETKLEVAPVSGEFTIKVSKKSDVPGQVGKVGLDVARVGNTLKIKRVCEGVVQDFNIRCPAMAVKAEDVIVGVNGTRGTGDELLSAIGGSEDLTLIISRTVPIYS